MSIKRRQNWLGQQRVDIPHLKSLESAVSNDFDDLLGGLVIGKDNSLVVRGMTINMPGAIGGAASGLQLLVEDSAFLHGSSDESGTFYTIDPGTDPEVLNSTTNEKVEGSFTPNTENYVGLEFVRSPEDSTADQVYFWNPTTDIEFTRTVPLAIILDYKIVISTSTFASNIMPIAVVETDSSNNVVSIEDRRGLLFRLASAGDAEPNPFYEYPWDEGREENFYKSTSSLSDPFAGGDKQISNMKEFFDAFMTEMKLIKGTSYWYSEGIGGSIAKLRQDIANTAFSGRGSVVHGTVDFKGQVAGMTTDVIIKTSAISAEGPITLVQNGSDIDTLISNWNAANPDDQILLYSGDGSQIPTANIILTSKEGQINWTSDIFINFIGGRLSYKLAINEETDDVVITDNQVAYIKLVRNEDVDPNLVFTNGSATVASVGAVDWTADLQAGDFIKNKAEFDEKYYEILTVDSPSQVTLVENFQEASSGASGFDAQYAFGTYESNPVPSTDRHIQIADRGSVPFGQDYFWLFFRADNGGSTAKAFIRVLGGTELEQGESQGISDNTSIDIINYIGSSGEFDNTPDYDTQATDTKDGNEHYNAVVSENLTERISRLTTMMADKAQDKTILLASDHTKITNTTNASAQEITMEGGTGTATVILPSSAANGTIGTTGTVSLNANQVAYYQVDRNATFSIANLGALTVSDISAAPLDEKTFIFAYRLADDTVYLWNNQWLGEGTLLDISLIRRNLNQNSNAKLIEGGTWSFVSLTNTITLSADAYIQVPSLLDARNTISAQSFVVNSGEVAYVEINRDSGATDVRPVIVDAIEDLDLENDEIFVVARKVSDGVLIGNHSFLLQDEDYLQLDGAKSEIDRRLDQLKVRPTETRGSRVIVDPSDIEQLNGSKLSLEQKNLLLSFDGAQIDFETGEVFESDGVTPFLAGANDFTPFAIPSGEYFYYSVSLLPNVANVDNTISGQILVIPAANSNASLAAAPKAPFPGSGIKLANVYVTTGTGSYVVVASASNLDSVDTLFDANDFAAQSFDPSASQNIDTIKLQLNRTNFENTLLDTNVATTGFDTITDIKWVGSSFTPTHSIKLSTITLNKIYRSGGATGQIRMDIYTDDGAGLPDTLVASNTNTVNANVLGTFAQARNFDFSAEPQLNAGQKYHFLVRGESLVGTVRVEEGANTYTGGEKISTTNSGGLWTATSSLDLDFLVKTRIPTVDLLVELQTDSSGEPSGTVLATSSVISPVNINPTATEVEFTIPSTPVSNGTTYWAVLKYTNTAVLAGRIAIYKSNSDVYAGGFKSLTTDGGSNWVSELTSDYAFEVSTATLEVEDIDYANIINLGVGGSGSGTGDANSDLTRYQDRLNIGLFEYANTNVAAVDEDDQVDGSSTASFDIPTGTFKFAENTADTLVSIQQLDSDFLAAESDIDKIELLAIWELDDIDTGATYEVSRDGGNEYQAVTMSRIGNSDLYRGIHEFDTEAANAFNQEYAVTNADGLSDLNDSTQLQLSQKFTTANSTVYKQVSVYINKNSASATGGLYVDVVRDDSGAPSTDPNDIVWSSVFQNINSLSVGDNAIDIPSQFALAPADYHIVFRTNQSYLDQFALNSSDKISVRIDSSAGPTPNLRTFDGATWSAELAGSTIVYRLEGREQDLRVRITSSATADDKFLRSYAVLYGYNSTAEFTSPTFREIFTFDGTSDNLNEFTLTQFLPDSRFLMCFALGTGQTFRYGDFVLDGSKVIFPPNTFNIVGTVQLEFFQINSVNPGPASTVADSLLTANHLGSTDGAIDKSANGRGIFLRRPDGTLREITVDDNDNIVIYSV